MPATETTEKKDIQEGEMELRLSDIIQFLTNSRRLFLIGAIGGLLVGILYAFTRPTVFTADVTVMPEIQARGGGLGNLGSLAGLAGINLDNANSIDAVRPELYPDIVQSVPFALYLLKQPVYSQKLKAKMTLQTFIDRINDDNFINSITNLFLSGDIKNDEEARLDPANFSRAIQVTKVQEQLIKWVQGTVTAVYDKKTGTLTITAVEQDPVVAATVTRLSLEYLTRYITSYRTEKATQQVVFLTQRVHEAKNRYQAVEYALSAYRDRNRNLLLQTAKIGEQRLQADYLLEQSVYNELSKQLEQARIKVQEETPIFKVLEPPTIPLRKSGPKRTYSALSTRVTWADLPPWYLRRNVLAICHSSDYLRIDCPASTFPRRSSAGGANKL